MKTILFLSRGWSFALFLFSTLSFGQLLTQDFNASGVLSTYFNSAAPTNGQFNAISTSGAGTVVSIEGGQLRFVRTGNAGSYSRTTDFSPTPTSLIYQFDITVTGNSAATTNAAVWQVGAGFGTANSGEPNSATHSRIALNISASAGSFSLRDIGGGSNSPVFSGKQTVTWLINNSGVSLNYTAPDASLQSVANDTFDVWIGSVQVFNDIPATTGTVALTDLKFALTGGAATIDLDNIYIDTMQTNLPSLSTGGIGFLSGFTYSEGAGPSPVQSFTLSAGNLDPAAGSVMVSPPPGYEVSLDGVAFSSSPVSVPYDSGGIPQTPPTRIYVRLKAGLQAGTYNNEDVSVSGGGAATVTVRCSGTVTKPSIALGTLTVTPMNYTLGTGPSSSANATVAGTSLNSNVIITPDDPARWEVSSDNTIWGSTAVYVPSAGVLSSGANRVYVRLKAGLPVGTYPGMITAVSPNAVAQTIAFSGAVIQPLILINTAAQDLALSGFSYDSGQGPSSPAQNFRLDGSGLSGSLTVNASAGWEISSNATYDGGNSAPYSEVVFAKSTANEVNNKGIHVRLKNGLPVGIHTGTLTVTSPYAVARTVTLSGEVFPPKVDMRVTGGANTISDGSTSLSGINRTLFGARNIGDSQTKSYTITNRGGSPLILGEINLSGPGRIDFSVLNAPVAGTVLSQGQSVDFDIRFAPTTVGSKTATVEIENNDPDNNPYDFAIGGNAKFCGASGEVVIAQQGFEEVAEFTELTYALINTEMYGVQTGFSSGKSDSNDKPAANNLYAEGLRGFKIQGGNEPNSTLTPLIIEFDAVDTSVYSNIDFSFKVAAFSLGSNANGMDSYDASGTPTTADAQKMDFVLAEISPDNGVTWYQQAKTVSDAENLGWGFGSLSAVSGARNYAANNGLTYFKSNTVQQYNHIVIQNIPAVPSLKIRISVQNNVDKEFWILDDVKLVSTGIVPKIWNGAVWLPSAPLASDKVIINGDYNTATSGGSLQVCQCEINAATLTVATDTHFIVSDQLINNGSIIVENDGNWVQVNETAVNAGTGNFTVKRNSGLKRLDYTYWSAPVAGQNLKTFSPGTLNNRFYTYNEGNDLFEEINPLSNIFGNNGTGAFESAAKGYAIRADNNYPTGNPAPLQLFNGVFTGIPNNGEVIFPLKYHSMTLPEGTGDGYNLVGNPYPSNIDFYRLANENTAVVQKTAWFWTNLNPNPAMQGSGYPGTGYFNNYAVLNGTGGIPATLGTDVDIQSATPTPVIKTGQGFLVKARQAGSLVFKNAFRTSEAGVFFNKEALGASESLKDRYWLHLTTPLNVVTTALVGYMEGATDAYEPDYDAPLLALGSDALFTPLEEYRLGIQGRKAPLLLTDVVPLGTSHYAAGGYTLSLGARDGIFANGQNIFLKDKQSGIVTNLSEGSYTFEAPQGLTEGRFEIVYEAQAVLATDGTDREELMVYRAGNDFVVKAQRKIITSVEVYDPAGRLVYTLTAHVLKVMIPAAHLPGGVYMLKINQNGQHTTKKIIR